MLYWCAGMYASGSTWTYNVMRAIAAATEADAQALARPVQGRFVNVAADLAGLDAAETVQVVKSHDLDEPVAGELRRRAVGRCVTIRDPRDAVTSLMLYQRFGFEPALEWVVRSARFCAGEADGEALLLRYETGFTDDTATLDRIAAAMGGGLAEARRTDIFAASRRGAVEAVIGGLESLPSAQLHPPSGDIFDPETQWHAHHAGRSGEIGRWRRMLRARQIRAVEAELAGFMTRFGYLAPPLFASGGSLILPGAG
jgi:hypothetical protein